MNPRALSKFLSLVLRHEAPNFGVTLDKNGWSPINRILPLLQRNEPRFTREDLRYLVTENDKQRYQIDLDRIRARYGLKPMKRRFVHLTPDRARAAHAVGARCHDERNFWLVKYVPLEFIEVGET